MHYLRTLDSLIELSGRCSRSRLKENRRLYGRGSDEVNELDSRTLWVRLAALPPHQCGKALPFRSFLFLGRLCLQLTLRGVASNHIAPPERQSLSALCGSKAAPTQLVVPVGLIFFHDEQVVCSGFLTKNFRGDAIKYFITINRAGFH